MTSFCYCSMLVISSVMSSGGVRLILISVDLSAWSCFHLNKYIAFASPDTSPMCSPFGLANVHRSNHHPQRRALAQLPLHSSLSLSRAENTWPLLYFSESAANTRSTFVGQAVSALASWTRGHGFSSRQVKSGTVLPTAASTKHNKSEM